MSEVVAVRRVSISGVGERARRAATSGMHLNEEGRAEAHPRRMGWSVACRADSLWCGKRTAKQSGSLVRAATPSPALSPAAGLSSLPLQGSGSALHE
jgi:hypothetical protein